MISLSACAMQEGSVAQPARYRGYWTEVGAFYKGYFWNMLLRPGLSDPNQR